MFPENLEPQVLYDASEHLLRAGGKRLRPFLVFKACEIVGGQRHDALPVAASIELIHNFTIIHDDIMDDDSKRRGVPTTHVLWGVPLAITAGDMLFAKAYEAALQSTIRPRQLLKILTCITHATIEICEGQALDVLFEKRSDVSENEYLAMVYKKTAALLKVAAESGALVGGGTGRQIQKLGKLATYAGLAFQVVDDILGITADETILGKPVGSDIKEGKRTILLIHALKHADDTQRQAILSVVGNREAKKDQIAHAIETISALQSIHYATDKAQTYIDKAKNQLASFPASSAKDILIDLCDYIVSRRY